MTQLTWLITGCSSGFGEALVLALTSRGDRVIATARKLEEIEHLKGDSVHTIKLDITSPQNEIDDVVLEAQKAFGGIDVLVNNAGYILGGPLEQVSGEKFLEVYRNNVVGTVNVIRGIMPHFRTKKSGLVIFMGSQSGWKGDLGATPYNATKFALEGIYEGFQEEAELFGIQTIIIEPGYFRTKIFDPSNIVIDVLPNEAYKEVNEGMQKLAQAVNGNQPGDPKKAAERIIDVVRSEGMAVGRTLPKRLPLGQDSLADIRKKCTETLKICDEWGELISSTDFDA
ncbi:NAD(P)-binding protein [Byssothecium circinans]|uniref:NAD(P)-binding protein n=1 Tax=Byssothecium circinans TaxID=147558 RepID=A0A6A5U8L0_9PLEO|nr:NAD(P)-binding protein [Byssothecium circinans]